MVDHGVVEDELFIDWDHLLDNLPDDLNFDVGDGLSTWSDSGCSLSIDDIEQHLMNNESNHSEEKDILAEGFFSDVLLDSVPGSESDRANDSSTSPESVVVETEEEEGDEKEREKPHENAVDLNVPPTKENGVVVEDDDDDHDAKKRKRKLRNRDAAVRSRERKKMYVRDLEMKSRYYEAECKRLGIMLQCYLAENQSLRLSLHNSQAFDASMTKQESAVLLLESLLLGSLLGFLGIIYLLILPGRLLSILEAGLVKNVDSTEWESVAPRKAGSKVFRFRFHSFMLGKGCKASRSRMKLALSAVEVVA